MYNHQTDWAAVDFSGGSFSNFGSGHAPCQWRKIGDMIEFRGLARHSGTLSAGNTAHICTVGTDAAPIIGDLYFTQPSAGGYTTRVFADASTGDVSVVVHSDFAGSNRWVSLSGIKWCLGDVDTTTNNFHQTSWTSIDLDDEDWSGFLVCRKIGDMVQMMANIEIGASVSPVAGTLGYLPNSIYYPTVEFIGTSDFTGAYGGRITISESDGEIIATPTPAALSAQCRFTFEYCIS